MKNFKITLIVILSCVMLYLCVSLGIALSRGDSSSWQAFGFWNSASPRTYASYSLAQEKEFTADAIDSILVDFGMNSNDVFFYQGTGDTVLIREYLNFTPKDSQLSSLSLDGGNLTIRGKRRNSFSFFMAPSQDGYVEIYLPSQSGNFPGSPDSTDALEFPESADASGSPGVSAFSLDPLCGLSLLQVRTVSGQITSELSFLLEKGFSVASTSGDIRFPQIKSETFQASSTSGNLQFLFTEADTLSLSTTSGDIFLEQAAGTLKLTSTSGTISLTKAAGKVTATTTSGDISLADVEGDVTANSTSGMIMLGSTTGDLSLTTTSGDISLQSGNGHLEAKSVSGDIRANSLVGNFNLNTTSGFLTLSDCTGCGKAHSISGDIRLYLQELTGNLSVSTTSGFVDCTLPTDTSLSLDFKSTSGECSTFFDEVLSFNKKGNQAHGQYGTGSPKEFSVSTTSGDLRIQEY